MSRELNRNKGQRRYRYKQAHRFAIERREGKTVSRITEEDWEKKVEELLKQEWSPEQIRGRLEKKDNDSISLTWIYEHVWEDKANGGDLHESLRCNSRYKNLSGAKDGSGQLKNRGAFGGQ